MFQTTSLNCLVPIETVEDSDYSEVMSFLSPLAVILQGKLINSFNKYDIQWSRQTGRISALKGSFGVSDFCQFGQFFPSDSNFPSGELIEQSYCLCKVQHWNSGDFSKAHSYWSKYLQHTDSGKLLFFWLEFFCLNFFFLVLIISFPSLYLYFWTLSIVTYTCICFISFKSFHIILGLFLFLQSINNPA